MKKGVTIKDIAKRLNMSISTVSKALSNDISISILTKERVKKQALDWSYVPNESARNFKLNKSFTIGLIIPKLLDQFYVFFQEKKNIGECLLSFPLLNFASSAIA